MSLQNQLQAVARLSANEHWSILASWCAMAEWVKEGGIAPAVPLIRILGRWSDNSASSVVRRQLVEDWGRAHPGMSIDYLTFLRDMYADGRPSGRRPRSPRISCPFRS